MPTLLAMNIVPPDERIDPVDDDFYDPYEDDEEEDVKGRYRALNRWALLSVVFGVLSVLTAFTWYMTVLPLAGIVLAIKALRQINRAPGEMIGQELALAGLALSVVLWSLGAGRLAIAQKNAIPTGYELINYVVLQPDAKTPDKKISEKAAELEDTRIFLRGYMYPGRQTMRLKEFIMVPNAGLCKFCVTKITPTQMVRVQLVGDLTADYRTNLTGIGGKFKIDPNPGLNTSPYIVEADVFR